MNLLLLGVLFGGGVLIEAIIYTPAVWRWHFARTLLVGVAVMALGFGAGAALFLGYWYILLPLTIVHLYRIFNLFRIAEGRMNDHYLRRATFKTSYRLIVAELVVIGVGFGLHEANTTYVVGALTALLCVMAIALLITARARLRQSAPIATDRTHHVTPTVTVAIPARNETKDLEECLQSLVHSNYSKLEILVLDDCSQGRRTPEIIRSFAQDGVRFLQGEPVRDYWLAKNQAYDTLTDHASGDVLIFCGVDTRFAPDTIQLLVDQLVVSKKQMLSILPLRAEHTMGRPFVQANRYLREFLLPSKLLDQPPVLSTCWVIYKTALKKHGLFDAVRQSVSPEGYFAKQTAANNEYSFIRSSQTIGLSSVKSALGQQRTALRTLYPALHKQPERVLLLTALVGLIAYVPLVLIVLGLTGITSALYIVPATVIISSLLWIYLRIIKITNILSVTQALLFAPLAALTDLLLLHVSMVRYEFSEVTWKGRNICEPVMHVLPHLPPLPEAPSPNAGRKS